ncbi:MAG: tetratricopeptide repeat protein [Chloroflexota bacterium]
MPTTQFRERFKYYLRRSRYNQKELAHELNIDASAISHRLSGRIPWRADFLMRICEVLELEESGQNELFDLAGLLTSTPSTPNQESIPLQRPPRVEYFTHRHDKELAEIITLLQPGAVITLCGPGGIGKTSLASAVAWTLAPSKRPPTCFPDGILFHSFYNQPQATLALEQIARSFGLDPLPTPRDAVQRILSTRQVLLILDGTERADDLQAILNVRGQSCALVTTRQRTDTESIRIDVKPFTLERSVSLLQRWVGSNADNEIAIRKICELIGGLPLAVRLAGRQMAQKELNAEEFLAWLFQTPLAALDAQERQHDSVPLLLKRSIEGLTSSARQALSAIGLLALSPIELTDIAEALGATATDALSPINELLNVSLLARSNSAYQVTHPLVHTYLQTQVDAHQELFCRLVSYFVGRFNEQTKLGVEGFSRLDPKRPHIMSLLDRGAERREWVAIQRLAQTADGYLDLQGHWTERLEVNEIGLEAARCQNNAEAESDFLTRLGNTNTRIGNFKAATSFHHQSLQIQRNLNNWQGEANSLDSLATVYHLTDRWNEAYELLNESLKIRKVHNDRVGQGNTLLLLGSLHRQQGEWLEASKLFEKSHQIFQMADNVRGVVISSQHISIIDFQMGHYERAARVGEESLAAARELGDKKTQAHQLIHLGSVYSRLGKFKQAIHRCTAGLELMQTLDSRAGEALALNGLGYAYFYQGELEEALQTHKASLQIKLSINERLGEGHSRLHIGRIYRIQGHLTKAIQELERSIDILQEIGNQWGVGDALHELGNVYRQLGDQAKAQALWQSALTKLPPESPEYAIVSDKLILRSV